MKHLEIAKALNYLLPEAKFVLSGDTLEGIDWLDERPLPTKNEIAEAIEQVKASELAEAEAKAQAKVDLLERLGITQDEANLLLS